jgi:hypothetical protein
MEKQNLRLTLSSARSLRRPKNMVRFCDEDPVFSPTVVDSAPIALHLL